MRGDGLWRGNVNGSYRCQFNETVRTGTQGITGLFASHHHNRSTTLAEAQHKLHETAIRRGNHEVPQAVTKEQLHRVNGQKDIGCVLSGNGVDGPKPAG